MRSPMTATLASPRVTLPACLGPRVSRSRIPCRLALGDGGVAPWARAIRSQAGGAEWAPAFEAVSALGGR